MFRFFLDCCVQNNIEQELGQPLAPTGMLAIRSHTIGRLPENLGASHIPLLVDLLVALGT